MKCRLLVGDMRERLSEIESDSIDAIVTDPPYGLGFMDKVWDHFKGPGDFPMRRRAPLDSVNGGVSRQGGRQRSGPDFQRRQARDMRAFEDTMRDYAERLLRVAKPGAHLVAFGSTRTFHRLWCGIEDAGWEIRDTLLWLHGQGFPKSANQTGDWDGWGTALKPAVEPIVLARKPLIGTVAQNLERHGVGALNIYACRVSPGGRWPANVLHDGSAEVVELFPESGGQQSNIRGDEPSECHSGVYSGPRGRVPFTGRNDVGSAARFFWCPKASRADRNEGLQGMPRRALNWSSGEENPGSFQSDGTDRTSENFHPTVKPTQLMRWLCRLVAPTGATVLDPFMGSGSTGKAAILEGLHFIGIELDPEYVEIARRRIVAPSPLLVEMEVFG